MVRNNSVLSYTGAHRYVCSATEEARDMQAPRGGYTRSWIFWTVFMLLLFSILLVHFPRHVVKRKTGDFLLWIYIYFGIKKEKRKSSDNFKLPMSQYNKIHQTQHRSSETKICPMPNPLRSDYHALRARHSRVWRSPVTQRPPSIQPQDNHHNGTTEQKDKNRLGLSRTWVETGIAFVNTTWISHSTQCCHPTTAISAGRIHLPRNKEGERAEDHSDKL
jgi:hypothetical protein